MTQNAHAHRYPSWSPDGLRNARLSIRFAEPWDLHGVKSTFFPIPACAVFGTRFDGERAVPLPSLAQTWHGKLPQANIAWAQAEEYVEHGAGGMRRANETHCGWLIALPLALFSRCDCRTTVSSDCRGEDGRSNGRGRRPRCCSKPTAFFERREEMGDHCRTGTLRVRGVTAEPGGVRASIPSQEAEFHPPGEGAHANAAVCWWVEIVDAEHDAEVVRSGTILQRQPPEKTPERILFIGVHPDDEIIAHPPLRMCVEAGKHCVIMVATPLRATGMPFRRRNVAVRGFPDDTTRVKHRRGGLFLCAALSDVLNGA